MCIHLVHHKRSGLNNVCQLPFILHTMPNISCFVEQIFAPEDLSNANAVGW